MSFDHSESHSAKLKKPVEKVASAMSVTHVVENEEEDENMPTESKDHLNSLEVIERLIELVKKSRFLNHVALSGLQLT